MNKPTNVVDLGSARAVKEFIESANDTIWLYRNALYNIMSAKDIRVMQEIAADALDEDLDTYNEDDDLAELDFEDDGNIPWDDIRDEE